MSRKEEDVFYSWKEGPSHDYLYRPCAKWPESFTTISHHGRDLESDGVQVKCQMYPASIDGERHVTTCYDRRPSKLQEADHLNHTSQLATLARIGIVDITNAVDEPSFAVGKARRPRSELERPLSR